MDLELKERLVGAAVLVALAVWLIPWILDGRDTEPSELSLPEDEVRLPVADTPARTQTRTIALTDAGRSAAAAEPVPAQAAPAVGGSGAMDSAGQSGSPGANAAEPARESVPPVATTDPATPSEPSSDALPARPQMTAAAPAEGWYVQLGSFSDADNAKRLAGRVATFGYKAEVSTYRSGGRILNRVRVGPSAGRDEAVAVASSLAAHGFVAQVVSAD